MRFNKRDYLWLSGETKEAIPVSDDSIQQTENILGVKLPHSYLNIMRNRVGNNLRFTIPAPTNYPYRNWLYSVSNFKPITGKGITESAYLCNVWGMPENLVLLAGDGHTWLALDYRNIEASEEPRVIFIDNDTEEQVYYLAPNFDSFLDSLTVNEDMTYQIGFKNVGNDCESIVKQINQLLGIELKHVEKTLIYSCFHPEWQSSYSDAKAAISFRPNSIYPWLPEYEWLLSFDIKDPQIEALIWQKISENIPYESKELGLSPTDFY